MSVTPALDVCGCFLCTEWILGMPPVQYAGYQTPLGIETMVMLTLAMVSSMQYFVFVSNKNKLSASKKETSLYRSFAIQQGCRHLKDSILLGSQDNHKILVVCQLQKGS